jgi:Phospholipid methyltransferase
MAGVVWPYHFLGKIKGEKEKLKMFEKQTQHYLLLAGFLIGVGLLSNDAALVGQFLGVKTRIWLSIAIAIPIVHQIFVWFVWRSELHHTLISRWFGANGFVYYAVGFTVLFVSRLILIIFLAISNRYSLSLNPIFSWVFSLIVTVPAAYLFYSVRKYFGFRRAFGIDHFDASYRKLPFVREGIFKLSDNAMYTYGFLILYIPGLLLHSKAALLAAIFNHLYIWVHFYCTESPDIKRMYA